MSHHMESSLSSTFIHLLPRASFPHLLHGALSQPHVYVVGVFCVFTLKASILCEVQDGMWLLLVLHKMSFMFTDGQQRRVLTFSLIWKRKFKKGSSVAILNNVFNEFKRRINGREGLKAWNIYNVWLICVLMMWSLQISFRLANIPKVQENHCWHKSKYSH